MKWQLSGVDSLCEHKRLCVCLFRIVDNMPVTWCYDVEDGQKFCNPGFPIGCYVTEGGRAKDACVVNVSGTDMDINKGLYNSIAQFHTMSPRPFHVMSSFLKIFTSM